MMRVALNGTALLSPLTGIGQYTYHLAHGLASTPGIELELFYGTGWSREILTSAPAAVKTLKSLLRRFMPRTYGFGRAVRQYKFTSGMNKRPVDIYHEPNFLAFKARVPSVITVHDLSWIRFPEAHPEERVRSMNTYFEPALRRAGLIITDSTFVKQELIEVFGIRPELIRPVGLGAAQIFQPRTAAQTAGVLARHGLVHGQYLLCVGTLEPRKNLHVALQSFMQLPAALRKRYPLVLVGMKGWHTSSLEKLMAPLIRSGDLKELGFVSTEDLATIFSGALTLIYPSFYEGFGLPPLESMACGVPVIASSVASLPEVVGDTGFLVDPHDARAITDAVELLIGDPARRAALSDAALQRSKTFSWARCASETVDAYRSVLGRQA